MTDELTQLALLDDVEDRTIDLEKPIKGVYFIMGRETRLIKIGVSTNIWSRYQTIKQGTGEEIGMIGYIGVDNMQRAKSLETFLHTFYFSYRRRGEWFELSSQEIKYLLATAGVIMHLCQGYKWSIVYSDNDGNAEVYSDTPFDPNAVTLLSKEYKKQSQKKK